MNQYPALIFKLVQTGVKRHCDTLLLIVLSIMMRRHLFLKTYRIQDYIPKNHALFQANMAKKTIPFGTAHTYMVHIGEYWLLKTEKM